MKLDAGKLAIAGAAVAGILWVICSALVIAMPDGMMNMTGYMMHGDFGNLRWNMGFGGFLFGLIGWAVVGAVLCWLLASIYNALAVN